MKNSEKHIAVCMLLAIMIAICGCQVESEPVAEFSYTALEVGCYDEMDDGAHASEYAAWAPERLNSHRDDSAARECTVTFNGVTYSGSYLRSSVDIPNTFLTHRYDADGVYFEVNAQTGELCYIIFAYEPDEVSTLDETQCRQIADAIAGNYIVLSDYKTEVMTQSVYSNVIYGFTYYREIDGYRTSDSVTVAIDGNGKVSFFSMNMLGAFENVQTVAFDSEKGEGAVLSKMETVYAEVSAEKEYQIENVILVKLDDGGYGFLYTVDVRLAEGDETTGSLVQLLVR